MRFHLGRPLLRRSTRSGAIAVLAAALLVQTVYLPRLAEASNPPSSTYQMSAAEDTVFGMINSARIDNGLAPLQLSSELRSIARGRSTDMLVNDYFSHTIPSCNCPVYPQFNAAGLDWSSGGENIGWNSGYSDDASPQKVHDAFMNSSGHRANILDPRWTHMAVGAIGATSINWNGHLSSPRMYTELFVALRSAPPPASPDPTISRLSGTDRYATAAAISAASFSAGVPVAYVATGRNFPDALAGAPVAARDGGPVLLTERDSIPAATAAELARLHPVKIIILGSAGVVSDAVAQQLRAYSSSVTRLAGADRYATAVAISQASFAPGVPVAYIATGGNFPDALAGAVPAGRAGGPVLLVKPGAIPANVATELARLRPGRIVILGSNGVVSDGVAAQLRSYSASVSRLAGPDRYATAAAISAASFSGANTVYLATGRNFPDALAGAVAASRAGGPILLVPGSTLPVAVRAEIARLRPTRVIYLGGPSVVADTLSGAIKAAW